jgi:predicted transcriptional regulator
MTVEEIACCLGMERSSVYKCINNLYRKGIVKREKISKFNGGGYRYVYFSINPSDLKTIVKRRLDYWINIIESVNGERFEDH